MTPPPRRPAYSLARSAIPSLALSVALALAACGGAEVPAASPQAGTGAPAPTSAPTAAAATGTSAPGPAPVSQVPPAPDTAEGGRLFDKFYGASKPFASFKPDSGKTKTSPDGKGGVDGTGILKLVNGDWLQNDTRHDYRFKNLFGWDLKGQAGIYGPSQMKKPYAVKRNLLAGKETIDELTALLTTGSEDIPAYGPVLDGSALRNIAAFIVAVRDGALPHPDSIFTLAPPDRGHYALRPGGDAARGQKMFGERCSGCHGADGTKLLFDDGAFSLGSHARQKAYEDWAKILNGQPGSPMGRQVQGATAKEMAQEILDLFAALCDRKAFPRGKATSEDVKDGDGRCAAYLK